MNIAKHNRNNKSGFSSNIDVKTVNGFGKEWSMFDQSLLESSEHEKIFNDYFRVFPWHLISTDKSIGVDVGCGSGRWAMLVAPRVHFLHLVDASEKALQVAKKNLKNIPNADFHNVSMEDMPMPDGSLDFAYSLGVLHHLPDTQKAINDISKKLKSGAPLLVYLYYAFDNRPLWYRFLWKVSDFFRKGISIMPFSIKFFISQVIAFLVYWPLARFAKLLEKLEILPRSFPLKDYRRLSFYTMRTDSLDRFGTRLEKRFTQREIEVMLKNAGFKDIIFSNEQPYWCAVGIKT